MKVGRREKGGKLVDRVKKKARGRELRANVVCQGARSCQGAPARAGLVGSEGAGLERGERTGCLLMCYWRADIKERRLCVLRLRWGLKTKQNKNSPCWWGSEVREARVVAVGGGDSDFPEDSHFCVLIFTLLLHPLRFAHFLFLV